MHVTHITGDPGAGTLPTQAPVRPELVLCLDGESEAQEG